MPANTLRDVLMFFESYYSSQPTSTLEVSLINASVVAANKPRLSCVRKSFGQIVPEAVSTSEIVDSLFEVARRKKNFGLKKH